MESLVRRHRLTALRKQEIETRAEVTRGSEFPRKRPTSILSRLGWVK
ncbi:uncharacterized protein G2W53_020203 [Senna tora]|uniref:Uncharacterized protein n=1 Tax=Senna tora TaxID=362788 RepID=A0A834WSA0_9FABA|nr:uncharacterized protein G2W53_020203 [Senna tora]